MMMMMTMMMMMMMMMMMFVCFARFDQCQIESFKSPTAASLHLNYRDTATTLPKHCHNGQNPRWAKGPDD